MMTRLINADDATASFGGYPQALEVSGTTRRLYVSGQVPVNTSGSVPETFAAQAELTWRNVLAQVRAAGMEKENIVKANIFLADRKYALENREARLRVLGDFCPALSVVIADIFDEAWLLEIEAIAEA